MNARQFYARLLADFRAWQHERKVRRRTIELAKKAEERDRERRRYDGVWLDVARTVGSNLAHAWTNEEPVGSNPGEPVR